MCMLFKIVHDIGIFPQNMVTKRSNISLVLAAVEKNHVCINLHFEMNNIP